MNYLKTYENFNSNNLTEEQNDRLIDGLSLNIYKGRKRDEKRRINYKQLNVKSLNSSTNKNTNNQNYTYKSEIKIELSNKDKIIGEYKKSENKGEISENSIKITINDKLLYHIDKEEFDVDKLIDHIIKQYKKFISEKWKVK